MPQLGSIATELVVASVLFVQTPFNLLLNGVYIFRKWVSDSPDMCPLEAHGHSVVKSACGVAPLSMKPFFDSAHRLNAFLFRSISILANNLEKSGKISEKTLTFVNGLKMFGESTRDPLLDKTVVGSISSMFASIPLEELGEKIADKLPSFNVGSSSAAASRALSAWKLTDIVASTVVSADFVYHFLVDVIYNTLKLQATVSPDNLVSLGLVKNLGKGLKVALYQNEKKHYETVTLQMLNACAGISLAIGYTNPYAVFLRHTCNAFVKVPAQVSTRLSASLSLSPAALTHTHTHTDLRLHQHVFGGPPHGQVHVQGFRWQQLCILRARQVLSRST